MDDVARILREYDEWKAEREEIVRRDEMEDMSDEWGWSDDAAVDLLNRLAEAVRGRV